jgi:phosphate transport system protein
VNHDSVAARALIPRDKEVDALNKKINAELILHMMENSDSVPRCLNLIIASRSLERIADHAKNVAEEVVYLYEAHDIRHAGVKGQGTPAPGV